MTRLHTYESAQSVLDELEIFHERLAAHYGDLGRAASDQRAKMLLEYLEKREDRQASAISRYVDSAAEGVLETWIHIPFSENPEDFLNKIEEDNKSDLNTDQIFGLASSADALVLSLLEHLANRCDVPSVKLLMQDLAESERRESIALSKTMNSLREI